MRDATEGTQAAAPRGPLRWASPLAERTFSRERPVATLLRLYVVANVAALTLALALGGPAGQAHGAAGAVWSWCSIG